MGAGFFDAFLFVKHSGPALLAKGSGPYFYLPKLEGRREARLWNDVLGDIERECGLPAGTVKVTVLIETLPAAFEMDAIRRELKQRIVGVHEHADAAEAVTTSSRPSSAVVVRRAMSCRIARRSP